MRPQRPPNQNLTISPGGQLKPDQVVGRDTLITEIWRDLNAQSVKLTAERRMGKTSIINKMVAEAPPGIVAIRRNVQDIFQPDEFAHRLIEDTQKHLPALTKARTKLSKQLSKIGKIGPLEFKLNDPQDWKAVVERVMAAASEVEGTTVVFFFDELPHMIQNIAARVSTDVAREVLDTLRAIRERHSGVRMVFSGSIGLHHVLRDLHASGGAWAPVNDMLTKEVGPLSGSDAAYLAQQLLVNERIACTDVDAVAARIATATEAVPFYVHHVAKALRERQRDWESPADPSIVDDAVVSKIEDPVDPWQLGHYVERVPQFYGVDAEPVYRVLDSIAVAEHDLTVDDIHRRVSGELGTDISLDHIRRHVELLGLDHYVVAHAGTVIFRLDLLKRAWRAKRYLG